MAYLRNRTIVYLVLSVAILGMATWLRVQDASSRVYHADEGVQSYQAYTLIENGEYRYDPQEHHGPLLYYVTSVLSPALKGADGGLSDFSMRVVPMAFSLGTILFGLLALAELGKGRALLWALLVGAAPLCVIYGSYYIQESLLAFFSLIALYSLYRYSNDCTRGWAIAFGLSAGFMHVTKETAILHLFAMVVAAVWFCRERIKWRWALKKNFILDLGVALLAAFLLHVVFFSSFGRNPDGILDGFAAYFNYADRSQGQGHEKEFLYYVRLFLPRTLEGIAWSELGVGLVMLLGSLLSLVKGGRNESRMLGRFLAANGLLLLVLYSVIPYKNPWLLLTPYLFFAYPAASFVFDSLSNGIRVIRDKGKEGRLLSIVSGGVGVVALIWVSSNVVASTKNAVFRFPSESRNPYLYVHTTPQYEKLLARLELLKSEMPIGEFSLAVLAPDAAWPLPWHLRAWSSVGYWTNVADAPHSSISIYDTRLVTANSEIFSESDFVEIHGLRPNTLLVLRVDELHKKHLIRE